MTEHQPYPSIKQGFIIILVSVLIALFIGLIELLLVKLFIFSDEKYKGIITFFSYVLPMIGVIVYAKNKRRASGNTTPLSFKSFSPSVFIVGLVAVFCIGFLLELFQYVLPVPDSFATLMEEMLTNNIFSVITAVVAAPVLEEILMRGIILDGFLKNYSPSKAIIWSAIIFGVFHLNPWQAVAGFAAGLILGWLYWQTKSLWLCILLHACNNGIASIEAEVIDMDKYPTLIHYLGMTNYMIASLVMTILLAGCMRYLDRYFKARKRIINTEQGDLPM